MTESRPDYGYHTMSQAALIAELESRDASIIVKDETIVTLTDTLAKMEIRLRYFTKKTFGSTSEKSSVILAGDKASDYVEFEEVAANAKPAQPTQPPEASKAMSENPGLQKPKRQYKQPHPGRSALPEELERVPIFIKIDDYDPTRDKLIAPLKSEKLFIKMLVGVEEIYRQRILRDGVIIVAPFPSNDPLYKHKLSVESMGFLAMARYQLDVPCYRLHQLFSKNTIGYNTMLETMGNVQKRLMPLAPVLLRETKKDAERLAIDEIPLDSLDSKEGIKAFKEQSDLLGWHNAGEYPVCGVKKNGENRTANATPTQAKEDAKDGENVGNKVKQIADKKKIIHTGRLWVLYNEVTSLVFIFSSMTRKANIAEWLLGDYSGLLISDAYPGYLSIARNKSMRIILMLCWAHARRRFTMLITPNEKNDPVVTEAIRRIRELYVIEKKLKKKSDDEIFAGRQESIRLLASFKTFLEEKRLLYTPKDAVTEAIDYLLNHWEFFIEYTNHGKLGVLDNNAAYPNFIIIQTLRLTS